MKLVAQRLRKVLLYLLAYIGLTVAFCLAFGYTKARIVEEIPATLFGGAVASAVLWYEIGKKESDHRRDMRTRDERDDTWVD